MRNDAARASRLKIRPAESTAMQLSIATALIAVVLAVLLTAGYAAADRGEHELSGPRASSAAEAPRQ
jgi:hypothetical protein